MITTTEQREHERKVRAEEESRQWGIKFADVFTQTKWALAEKKLNQFRRHPDYAKALRKIFDSADDLKTTSDGKMLDGILDENLQEWQNRADQEFIDEIIRNGG
jgi:hypothetical protein